MIIRFNPTGLYMNNVYAKLCEKCDGLLDYLFDYVVEQQ